MEETADTLPASPLSTWLKSVIVDLAESILDSEGWGNVLGVSLQEVQEWLTGRSAPASRDLDSILCVLEKNYPAFAAEQLAAFAAIADAPLQETAPNLRTHAHTLNAYRLLDYFERLRLAIGPLPPPRQRELLQEMIAACSEEVLGLPRRPS